MFLKWFKKRSYGSYGLQVTIGTYLDMSLARLNLETKFQKGNRFIRCAFICDLIGDSITGSWAGSRVLGRAGLVLAWGGNQGGGGGGVWGLGEATYSQAKLPTVRQSYLLSGKQRTIVRQAKRVRHAPNRSMDLHPTTA